MMLFNVSFGKPDPPSSYSLGRDVMVCANSYEEAMEKACKYLSDNCHVKTPVLTYDGSLNAQDDSDYSEFIRSVRVVSEMFVP